MASILILYSTTDGHTRHICQHIQQRLEAAGHCVTLASIINEVPENFPATALYDFRLATVGLQLTLWTVLSLVFGYLAEKSLVRSGNYRTARAGV